MQSSWTTRETNCYIVRGHYTIPIDPYKTILNHENNNVPLIASSSSRIIKLKHQAKTANELHSQFSHPRPEKLVKLIISKGDPWKSAKELKDAKSVTLVKYIGKKHLLKQENLVSQD